ncbi:bifunctional glutamate N-acetyltransferase/amino-acid acetyltransferase ArgJ [Desulfosarcina ovata]|uniref:Arginine biosynthesis bifunctional protein ArgJ n=1 Tax=Desulfosarcina ovata subsp. ovata TaxID=2752305 RepID=A0A5K8A5S8_9BACT|nr:bifunctional glutamate N-acetyltransferase/amino-acid acetyltransferase ArgJ [Desulfosarcina ovata]BBO87811.1 arginine biosynthesis bifunctional protein ArgJ [Desulfosarcina ovata subsp. ovata]
MVPLKCKGFRAGGVAAGIKKNGDLDLGLLVSDRPARVAAVFTKNRILAAPVKLNRERVKTGMARAVIANAGNANCANGSEGMAAAIAMTAAAAHALNVPDEQVLAASTGVIGAPFPNQKVAAAVPVLVGALDEDGILDLARAIMTTDTRPKAGVREAVVNGAPYRIVAVAKGAGMIRPDMATMLCFACTDADVALDDLQAALKRSVDLSFNRITIDGDTSTNDTVILMANGASDVKIDTIEAKASFQQQLDDLLMDLARQMVRDGEGVTKVVDLTVRGARSNDDAWRIADTISHSPLVKTAFFGQDANWGRIFAAAGRAGVELDPDRLDLYFDDVQMTKGGTGCGDEAEAKATAVLKQPEFSVTLDLNLGEGTAGMLTCDFSLDYVKINADYRS